MQESPYLKDKEELVTKFKAIPFFKTIDKGYIKEILNLSKIRSYDPEEVIAKEGDLDCWIYVVIAGEVKVMKQGKEIARMDDKSIASFGELAMIDGEARSASVVAVTGTTCLAIDASFLDRLKVSERNAFFSVFYRLLAEILCGRLRKTDEELVRVKEELEQLKKA